MVLCWIALPVFALLGLFSLKYRRLTKEAFYCLSRKIQRRPCTSSLDERIRGDVTGSLMKFSPSIAKGFYKHYKAIVFITLIITILSTVFAVIGIYNYVQYGNCNGKDSSEFCIIDKALNDTKEEKNPLIVLPNISCNHSFPWLYSE